MNHFTTSWKGQVVWPLGYLRRVCVSIEKVGPCHQKVQSRDGVTDNPKSSIVFSVPDLNSCVEQGGGWTLCEIYSKVYYKWCSWSRLERGWIRSVPAPAGAVQRDLQSRWYCGGIDICVSVCNISHHTFSQKIQTRWILYDLFRPMSQPARLMYLSVSDSTCESTPSLSPLSSLTHGHRCIGPHNTTRPMSQLAQLVRLMYLSVFDTPLSLVLSVIRNKKSPVPHTTKFSYLFIYCSK